MKKIKRNAPIIFAVAMIILIIVMGIYNCHNVLAETCPFCEATIVNETCVVDGTSRVIGRCEKNNHFCYNVPEWFFSVIK